MTDFVFFYGTLMTGFDRRRRAGMNEKLEFVGRGSIEAALFDLGLYPAAVPATDGRVWGEVHRMRDPVEMLAALDEIEGHRPDDTDHSLYTRAETEITLDGGRVVLGWVYFYNAPLGGGQRIFSGDYLNHVKAP